MSTPPPVTALVVDDDDAIREVARLALEVFTGWHVVVASSGVRALELLRSTPVDVVLMDLMMPELDGLATVELMRRDAATADLPVVLLTAKATVGPVQPWDGHDISGVVAKPFSVQTLGAEVCALLGWPSPRTGTR